MFVGITKEGKEIHACDYSDAIKCYCKRCGQELILNNSNPCLPIFNHKIKNCDWYINSDRKEVWCKKFPTKFRDIIRYSPLENHIVDIDINNRLTVEFITKEITNKEWKNRFNFYRELNNRVVILKRIPTKCISYIDSYYDILKGSIKCSWFTDKENIQFSNNTNVELFMQFPNDIILWVNKINMKNEEFQIDGRAILTPNEFIDLLRLMYLNKNDYRDFLLNTNEIKCTLGKLEYKGIPYLHKLVNKNANVIQSEISKIETILKGYNMVKSTKGHSKKIIYDKQIIKYNNRLFYYKESLIRKRKYTADEIEEMIENKSKEFDKGLEIFKRYLNDYTFEKEIKYKERLSSLRKELSVLSYILKCNDLKKSIDCIMNNRI